MDTSFASSSSTTSSSKRPTSFLDLPAEIRLQIYDLSLKPAKLTKRPIRETEWVISHSQESKPVFPGLLLAHPQIYNEAAPIFYSRATLEITPVQSIMTEKRSVEEYLAMHRSAYSFCPSDLLRLIKTVHVYCDQEWMVNVECFRAMFRWIIESTNVKGVYLSRKVMQQKRHLSEGPDGELGMVDVEGTEIECEDECHDYHSSPHTTPSSRTIDIYARSVSWRLRGMGGCIARIPKPPPGVHVYSYQDGANRRGKLSRELTCVNSEDGTVNAAETEQTKEIICQKEMERFAKSELGDFDLELDHQEGYLWLYKTIQIRKDTGSILGDSIMSDA